MASDDPQGSPEFSEHASQPVPPKGVVYYTKYGEARIEHPRVAVIGVLNLIFFFPYLIITALTLIGAANPLANIGLEIKLELDANTIIGLVCLGLGGLLLLVGGILLLRHKAVGKGLTQLAGVILVGYVIYNIVVMITNLQGREFDLNMIPSLMLPGLLMLYPLIAFFVINRPAAELDLR